MVKWGWFSFLLEELFSCYNVRVVTGDFHWYWNQQEQMEMLTTSRGRMVLSLLNSNIYRDTITRAGVLFSLPCQWQGLFHSAFSSLQWIPWSVRMNRLSVSSCKLCLLWRIPIKPIQGSSPHPTAFTLPQSWTERSGLVVMCLRLKEIHCYSRWHTRPVLCCFSSLCLRGSCLPSISSWCPKRRAII